MTAHPFSSHTTTIAAAAATSLCITKSLSSPTRFTVDQVVAESGSTAPFLVIQEKAPSLHSRKEVFGARGYKLYEIMQEKTGVWVVVITGAGYADAAGGREVMRVVKGGRFSSNTATAVIYPPPSPLHYTAITRPQRDTICLRTNFFDTKAEIVEQGKQRDTLLASIDRGFFSGKVIFSRSTYNLCVRQGEDAALMAVLSVLWDGIMHSGSGTATASVSVRAR